ncbi:Threonine synthase [Pseudomonas sp. R3-18-08]|nr:Threonine synthase [Pseudomonas sp. R3-18-08]
MRSEPLLILLLILSAPLNHAGRNSTVTWGVNRQGCRFSRPAPWMARGGGPPNHCRITGTPSLSEVPSGGARAFCLLLRFSKVRRRKGGTHSSRYRSNGYVLALIQHPGRLSGRHREQAPSHIWIARHQSDSYRPPGRHGSKLPRHRFRATPKLCRYLWLSGASPNASQLRLFVGARRAASPCSRKTHRHRVYSGSTRYR